MQLIRALLSLLIVLAIFAAAGAAAGWVWFENEIGRDGPAETETVFTVSPGESLVSVASRLEDEGLVRDARLLRLKARLDGVESDVKAGEFALPPALSAGEILARLVEGRSVQYALTIPEGLTVAQALRVVEANEVLTGPLPDPAPPEGSLLADTYHFTRGETRAAIIKRMQDEQDALMEDLWPGRASDLPVETRRDAIILASVVQREASGKGEYGKVASVFINRLNRPMRLQSDPTVIYGVSQGEPLYNRAGQRRPLLRSELDRDTPWNTYTRDGLPETPIANPGRGAIQAVLNPPETDFLYFVADGTGGHVFARTLAEHNRNVAAYREYERREIARERSN